MNEKYTLEETKKLINKFGLTNYVDLDFIYGIYSVAFEGILELNDSSNDISVNYIDSFALVQYCIGEYLYIFSPLDNERKKSIMEKEKNSNQIASIVADKYLSLGLFNYNEQKFNNKFSPEISSINLYLNFILNILKGYNKNNPRVTLIRDLLMKSISISS